mgnify:CR=1 FL=1
MFGLFEVASSIFGGGSPLDPITDIISEAGNLVGGIVKGLPKPLQIASQVGLSQAFMTPQLWDESLQIVDAVADKLPGSRFVKYGIDQIEIGGVSVGNARNFTEIVTRPFHEGYQGGSAPSGTNQPSGFLAPQQAGERNMPQGSHVWGSTEFPKQRNDNFRLPIMPAHSDQGMLSENVPAQGRMNAGSPYGGESQTSMAERRLLQQRMNEIWS